MEAMHQWIAALKKNSENKVTLHDTLTVDTKQASKPTVEIAGEEVIPGNHL
jgi:hypothetical protein